MKFLLLIFNDFNRFFLLFFLPSRVCGWVLKNWLDHFRARVYPLSTPEGGAAGEWA
ncbi:hypothetical protein [Neorhizobium galegae]|uniref:hypothetical protein n=1 Tax=Neorhizobium galegae TaxID=399 RepID=UPI0021034774|nr:hypothetical protein [Neorhizobium galegae]MCQ1852761.1 hypothetical protein [Neorhizobium galegae]